VGDAKGGSWGDASLQCAMVGAGLLQGLRYVPAVLAGRLQWGLPAGVAAPAAPHAAACPLSSMLSSS
jgi:hypothetical protein